MPLEEETNESEAQAMGRKMLKKMLNNALMLLLVIIYVVGGAYLFIDLEYDLYEDNLVATVEMSAAIEAQKNKLADDLWFHKQQPDYDALVEQLVEEYHRNVTDAIADAGYPGKVVTRDDMSNSWEFASALLFTISVVTTIGYGHVSPTTATGQAVLIGYALIGIPLMLMFLANIGDSMARFFRNAYSNGCCRCCTRRREREYTDFLREQELEKLGKGKKKKKGKISGAGDNGPPAPSWDDFDDNASLSNMARNPDANTTVVEEIEDDDEEPVMSNVPITLVLCIIAAYVLIGALLFGYWNEWSMIKGAYFSFVTLSTIGFGDLQPGWDNLGTTKGTIELCLSNAYIVIGLAVLSMAFNLMMEEMINKFKWLGKKIGVVDGADEAVDGTEEAMADIAANDTEQLVANEAGNAAAHA